MPKNTHTIPNWQAERAKKLGTARQRRAAFAMFAPVDGANPRVYAEKAKAGSPNPAIAACPTAPEAPHMTVNSGVRGAQMTQPDYQIDLDLATPQASRLAKDAPGLPPSPEKATDKPGAGGIPPQGNNIMSRSQTLKSSTAPVENLAPKLQPNVGARMVRKVTVAGLLPKNYEHPRGAPDLWLADFFCQVSGSKPEEYDGRPYLRWLGDFRRVDLSSGQIVGGATAIFPSIASDRIEAAMGLGENAAGGVRTNVEMAFRLGITGEGRTGREGYAWTLQTIMQPNYVAPIDRFVAECYRQPEALTGPEEQEMDEEAAQ